MRFNATRLDDAFGLLAKHLELAKAPQISVVVCGGASLIATKVVARTTKDVDIVAFRSENLGL
jgi:hypothetical protein